ncbi:ABC transporter ATP-binding protein [Pelomicrobium sp. G1]|uniref:ABC transporter ATP-binding protein n=1 Tax=unclassified Pelomicrobium TaxID=2815318 RepID=UPI003F75B35F
MSELGLAVEFRQTGPIPLNAQFHCAPGELVVLVGPSGSGKSTILRCIAGLYRPSWGQVRCDGEVWLDTGRAIVRRPQERSVGFVFQDYALFPHLSAVENVAAALGHLPREQRLSRARQLLKQVHLDGLEFRRPKELSGGQQQRVAVARALAREPKVLLMDEPFSAVDHVTRRKLQRELVQLRRDLRLPIVLVTHDLEEARMLADRMVILQRGATLTAAAPEELMARPGSVAVARLLGHTNLFHGVVMKERPERGLSLIRWRDLTLEARHDPRFPAGTAVAWLIPPESVILHRRDRPSRGERENPVAGVVDECIPLGEMTAVTMRVEGSEALPLALSVPTHVARRNRVAPGEPIRVSLLAEAIHLMPPESAAER